MRCEHRLELARSKSWQQRPLNCLQPRFAALCQNRVWRNFAEAARPPLTSSVAICGRFSNFL